MVEGLGLCAAGSWKLYCQKSPPVGSPKAKWIQWRGRTKSDSEDSDELVIKVPEYLGGNRKTGGVLLGPLPGGGGEPFWSEGALERPAKPAATVTQPRISGRKWMDAIQPAHFYLITQIKPIW